VLQSKSFIPGEPHLKVRNRDWLNIEKAGTANVTKFFTESHLREDAIDPLLHV
jgi:hypothetical protein